MSAAIEQRNQEATCYCGNLDEQVRMLHDTHGSTTTTTTTTNFDGVFAVQLLYSAIHPTPKRRRRRRRQHAVRQRSQRHLSVS